MRRWLIPIGLAFVGLILSTHVLPFHDDFLELQPDGKSLGRIPASDFRFAAVIAGGLPLLFLAAVAGVSRRFRSWATPWKAVALGFFVGLVPVLWLSR